MPDIQERRRRVSTDAPSSGGDIRTSYPRSPTRSGAQTPSVDGDPTGPTVSPRGPGPADRLTNVDVDSFVEAERQRLASDARAQQTAAQYRDAATPYGGMARELAAERGYGSGSVRPGEFDGPRGPHEGYVPESYGSPEHTAYRPPLDTLPPAEGTYRPPPTKTDPGTTVVPDAGITETADQMDPTTGGGQAEGNTSGGNPLGGLAEIIAGLIANPNPYEMDDIQQMRDFMSGERDRTRKLRTADLKTNAANRGVYYGTPLTTSLGDLETELSRSEAQYDTELTKMAADARQRSLSGYLGNALQFLTGAQGDQSIQNQLALGAQGLGLQGGPNMNQAMAQIMALAGNGPGQLDSTMIAQLMGILFGGGQSQNG